MAKDNETPKVSVRCSECGNGYRNHAVLFEVNQGYGDDCGVDHYEYHQLIRCLGCDTVKYRRFSIGQECDSTTGEHLQYGEHVFPSDELEPGKRQVSTFGDEEDSIPATVRKMYKETIICLNAKARTLAGGGLRATVEAICLDQGLQKGTLISKIDELVSRGLLTKSQADYLHEERYIGNAALHELETPSNEDIELGLTIVEGLLNTIYVLPAKAEQLKKRRESKASKKEPPAKR
jgi:hypothetical protein